MSPAEIVKAIENVIDEHKHGGDIGPLRKIATLLKSLRGFTAYTDEMIDKVQATSENFYDGADPTSEQQYRHEMLAAVYRLKNAVSMMEEQLPADISVQS